MMKTTSASNFSKKIFLIIFSCHFMIFFAGCSSTGPRDGDTVFLFKDITVIDAVNGLRVGQSVMIRGNKIVEVGLAEEIEEPSGATIVDGSGKYMIPGLWDAH
ncbi:MAG: hypothetical protein WD625_09060, partial [Balneolales bacterium]